MALSGTEMLARMPRVLGGKLVICACGHTVESHLAGRDCIHLNHDTRNESAKADVRAKARNVDDLCTCTRFQPDPRLPDGEVFVRRVLQKVLAKEALPVEQVDIDESLAVLFRQLWRTSEKYDSRSHVRFRVYAYLELYNDAIDHVRSDWGRHGQHRVFDPRAGDEDGFGDGAAFVDRSDSVASPHAGDDPDHWATDFGGLLAEADRPDLEASGRAGRGDGRRDAGGDHGAGVRAAGRPRAAAAGARGAVARRPFVDCAACDWRNYVEPPNGIPGWHEPDVCRGCGATLDSGVT